MFDIAKLVDYAQSEIEAFALNHPDETFYSFSLDSNLLCLNSEEKFKEVLKRYQSGNGDRYQSEDEIKKLKYNTGDWEYQGFAEFQEENGFDDAAYDEHYELSDEEQKTSAYGFAMDAVLLELIKRKAFDCLKTKDFIANRVEHNY